MKKMLTRALICMSSWALGACEKELISNETVITDSSLSIITRSVTAEETVSFPVNIFVFNNENKSFVKKETFMEEGESIELNLPFGTYDIYVIGGVDGDRYNLPNEAEITEESEITLINGKEHADLMTAHDGITLDKKEGNQLTLSMERVVTELTQATIRQVPEYVTDVSISLSPCYKSILINGGINNSWNHEYALHNDGEGIWTLPSPTMLLVDSEEAIITISFKQGDGTIKNYSYTCTEEIKKNHQISITATYHESNDAQVTGVLTGTSWVGTQEIVFEFGDDNSSTDKYDDDEEDIINEVAPMEYSIYKKCFVLKVTPNEKGYKEVLLLYNDDFTIETTGKSEEQILQEINTQLESVTINGITGWRLPNEDEVKIVVNNTNVIKKIVESKFNNLNKDFYLYSKNNTLKAYSIDVDGRDYYIATQYRPVTTLKFKK